MTLPKASATGLRSTFAIPGRVSSRVEICEPPSSVTTRVLLYCVPAPLQAAVPAGAFPAGRKLHISGALTLVVLTTTSLLGALLARRKPGEEGSRSGIPLVRPSEPQSCTR